MIICITISVLWRLATKCVYCSLVIIYSPVIILSSDYIPYLRGPLNLGVPIIRSKLITNVFSKSTITILFKLCSNVALKEKTKHIVRHDTKVAIDICCFFTLTRCVLYLKISIINSIHILLKCEHKLFKTGVPIINYITACAEIILFIL